MVRILSDVEKATMQKVKDDGLALCELLDKLTVAYPGAGREFALAKTKLEEAVMWAVKGLTK